MRILITTQVVDRNDPDLGFFHRWIEEFAKYYERVEVICLYEGEHSFPENVYVHSLGKEEMKSSSFATSLIYAIRFKSLIWNLRDQYDAVFVHMNPEYVIIGGLFWRLWKKRIGLWYLHKSVDLKLRLAVLLTDVVFTASEESFHLESSKVRIVGHGIALEKSKEITKPSGSQLRLVTIGRISPAKKIDTMLDAVEVVVSYAEMQGRTVTFDILGAAGRPEEHKYETQLHERVSNSSIKDAVRFLGPKTHAEVAAFLPTYEVFLHASTGTGSLDKAVLEALLSGVPVISTSPAFQELLGPYGLFVKEREKETGKNMAIALVAFEMKSEQEKASIRLGLQERIARDYSLENLIPRLVYLLKNPNHDAEYTAESAAQAHTVE